MKTKNIFFLSVYTLLSLLLPAFFAPFAADAAWGVPLSAALLAGGGALVAGALIGNLVCALRSRRRMLAVRADAAKAFAETVQKSIVEDPARERKKLLRFFALARAYSCLLLFAGILTAFGACGLTAHAAASLSVDMLFLTALLLRAALFVLLEAVPLFTLAAVPMSEGEPSENALPQEEYPALYAILQRAKEAVGYGRSAVFVREGAGSTDGALGIRETGGRACITLPPVLFCLATEEELYAALVHECAHAVSRDTALARRIHVINFQYRGKAFYAFWRNLFFSEIGERLGFRCEVYQTYASLLCEQRADEAVRLHADGQAFINFLAKSALRAEFYRTPHRELSYDLYASEQPPTDLYTRHLTYLEATMSELCAQKKHILLRTLPAKKDSHPTLKMRMEALGAEDFDVTAREKDGALFLEQRRYLAEYDADAASDAEGYRRARESNYLGPKENMARYERGEANAYEDYLALSAYADVDSGKALALADKILSSRGCMDTRFIRARLLCQTDDPAGIPAMREVLLHSLDYFSPADEIYTEAVLRSGDEKLLEAARAEQAQIIQRVIDELKRRMKIRPNTNSILACDPEESKILAMKKALEHCASHVWIARLKSGPADYIVYADADFADDPLPYYFFSSQEDMGNVYFLFAESGRMAAIVQRTGTLLH